MVEILEINFIDIILIISIRTKYKIFNRYNYRNYYK